MVWLKGVFRCNQLGVDDCVVWWDAVGALGAWIAAFVTFLAVIVPIAVSAIYQRRRAEELLEDFAAEFAAASDHIAWLARYLVDQQRRDERPPAQMQDLGDWQMLRFAIGFPVLNAPWRLRHVDRAIRKLRRAVVDWNKEIDLRRNAGQLHGPFPTRLYGLQSKLHQMACAALDTAKHLPLSDEDLARIEAVLAAAQKSAKGS